MQTSLIDISKSKKYFSVFLLTFSWIVYLIPYLATDFYSQFLIAYNLTDGQLGNIITFFGLTATPGYFIGGFLADKFNAKRLVVLSCLSTAASAIAISMVESYFLLVFLYLIMGFTSAGLHWSAHLKIIRGLGDSDEQGRLFGAADTAYGLFTIFMTYGVLTLMSTVLENLNIGFRGVIVIYSMIAILIGLAVLVVVPFDARANLGENSEEIKLSQLGKVLKMPFTYYLGFFTLGFYLIRCIVPYVNPHLSTSFGISVAFATGFSMTARTGIKMISGPIGGILRDKIKNSTLVILLGGAGATIFSLVMAFLPTGPDMAIYLMVLTILVVFFSGMVSPLLYTSVSDAKIPMQYTGTILGIASTIGYSADIWLYSLCGSWLDNYGASAYSYIYILMASGGVLMIVMGLFLRSCYRKVAKESKISLIGE